MTDDRRLMRELGITLEDVARRTGIDMSYVGKQVRGDRHMSRPVRRALDALLRERAIICLPLTSRLLREMGEEEATEACERVWSQISEPSDTRDDRARP